MAADKEHLQNWLAMAHAVDDGSRIFTIGTAVLERLAGRISSLRTQLLPAYPQPANPEVWIPFILSQASDVRIRIYDGRGRLVRELGLGFQSAGQYITRDMALRWDGRNRQGEAVTSGLYFYRLQAHGEDHVRRLVVHK